MKISNNWLFALPDANDLGIIVLRRGPPPKLENTAVCPCLQKSLLVVPAFVFGTFAFVLLAHAVTGPIVPTASLTVAASAVAPESLSATTTTRDWTETAGSIVRRR